MGNNKIRSVLLSLAVLGGTGFFLCTRAAAEQRSGVRVQIRSTQVKLTVGATISLDIVMAELCKQTRSMCEGVPLVSHFQIVPMSVSGSWQEVVSRLMQGTGLDFIASSSSAGAPGTLILRVPSTLTSQAQPAAPAPVAGASEAAVANDTTVSPETQGRASAMPTGISQGSNQATSGHLATAYPFNQSSEALAAARKWDWNGNPLTHDVAMRAPEPSQYLLFPGPNGELIPATEPGPPPGFLPWPDGHGGLLPAPPVVGNSVWPITYSPK